MWLLESDTNLREIVPVVCFNAWGCHGFEGYVFTGIVPALAVIVGALLAKRWIDLPVAAFVGLACALVTEYLLYSFDHGWAGGLQLLSDWDYFGVAYVLMLIVAVVAHMPKRAVSAFIRRRNA